MAALRAGFSKDNMTPLLPGDYLWDRYRVESVERGAFRGAWLSTLQGNGQAALVDLNAADSRPFAALLTQLSHGVHAPKTPPSRKGRASSPPVENTNPALPLVGAVEWFGGPDTGQAAVVPVEASHSLSAWVAKHGPMSVAQLVPMFGAFAEDLGQLAKRLIDPRLRKPPEAALRALAACLTPDGVGILQGKPVWILRAVLEVPSEGRYPRPWAEYLAPEIYSDKATGPDVLVFGLARLAAFALGAGEGPLPRNEAAWGTLSQWIAGKRDAGVEFAPRASAQKIPEEFAALLERCLARRPSKRVQNIDKFVAALTKMTLQPWAEKTRGCLRCEFVLQPAPSSKSECPVCGEAVPSQPQGGGAGRSGGSGRGKKGAGGTRGPMERADTVATLQAASTEGMCVIEAGPYLAGEDLTPRTLRAFAIDRLPVTEGDYKRYLNTTNAKPREGGPGSRKAEFDEHPVINVTWHEAVEFAEHHGKRLPTVYEWEKSARGTDGRKFPFGNQFRTEYARLRSHDTPEVVPETHAVGSLPQSASPYGVEDLIGNVLQWTSTARRAGDRIYRAAKGSCAADSAPELLRCSGVQYLLPDTSDAMVGFRCVKDLE